jgi:hypothetical protein
MTNSLARESDNPVGKGIRRKRMISCNEMYKGSNFALYRKIAHFLKVLKTRNMSCN